MPLTENEYEYVVHGLKSPTEIVFDAAIDLAVLIGFEFCDLSEFTTYKVGVRDYIEENWRKELYFRRHRLCPESPKSYDPDSDTIERKLNARLLLVRVLMDRTGRLSRSRRARLNFLLDMIPPTDEIEERMIQNPRSTVAYEAVALHSSQHSLLDIRDLRKRL